MQSQKEKRTIDVSTTMTPSEYESFRKDLENSACMTSSSYVRKVLLREPVTVFCRNRSLDELTEELIVVKRSLDEKILNAIWKYEIAKAIAEIKELLIKISDYVRENKIHKKSRRPPAI